MLRVTKQIKDTKKMYQRRIDELKTMRQTKEVKSEIRSLEKSINQVYKTSTSKFDVKRIFRKCGILTNKGKYRFDDSISKKNYIFIPKDKKMPTYYFSKDGSRVSVLKK